MTSTNLMIDHYRVPVAGMSCVHVVEIRSHETESSASPAVIILHGTGPSGYGTRRWRFRFARQCAAAGLNSYLFESRGIGYSDGDFESWNVSTFLEDALAVFN
jgi:alpha-beta hydrolase superfamily lysophospholipase